MYILEDWGSASKAQLKKWVKTLLIDGVGGTNPCQFDEQNLNWSAEAIMDSISPSLWTSVEKATGTETTGPEVFITIVEKLQQTNASSIRALVEKLKRKKAEPSTWTRCGSLFR